MAKKSKEVTAVKEVTEANNEQQQLSSEEYEKLRKELLDILSTPGGSPGHFTLLQKRLIEGLDAARKAEIAEQGDAVVCTKLRKMDSLIITAAIQNLKNSCENNCGVHYPLISFARAILLKQKEDYDRMFDTKNKKALPFDLSFLMGASKKLELPQDNVTSLQMDRVWALHKQGKSNSVIAVMVSLPTPRVVRIINERKKEEQALDGTVTI